MDENGNVVLGDECSHRTAQDSGLRRIRSRKVTAVICKQFVRDWLKANPDSDYLLPDDVIDKTIAKYKEAFELLTGRKFA